MQDSLDVADNVTNLESSMENSLSKSLGKSWAVCLTGALFFFYIFIQMTKFNAIGHDLMVDFKMTSSGLGTLSSIYFWGNVAFLFPAGILLDRFSSKKILILMMGIAIVATFLFSYTTTIGSASWCFFFTGIAGAFALMLPLRLASRWFPPEKMALASGLIITIGFFGAMVSQTPLTWLVNSIGWRHAMQWNAGLGIIILAAMVAVIKDFPEGGKMEMSQEQATSVRFLLKSLKNVITNRQNWLFGIYTCLVNLPVFIYGAAFGARYLQQAFNVTQDQSSFAMVLLFIGAMAGSPAFGWISDHMKSRKVPMYLGAIISFLLILWLMYATSLSYVSIYLILFAIGFFTSSQVISYPVFAESNEPVNIATSFGLGSTLIMSGGAIFMPLFGWLLDLNWDGKLVNGMPIYSIADYRIAFWMLPLAILVATIGIIFGKETCCKRIA